MEIDIKGYTFKLLPQKAVYWNQEKTLLISDLHLGKVTYFRKEGIAIPSIALENNFARLDELLLHAEVKRIIFLGDLFHHHYNQEWELFAAWRLRNPAIEMIIVQGNHDILPQHLFSTINIQLHTKQLVDGPFLFIHHPQEIIPEGLHAFCGHIHPVFRLYARGRQSIKMPCFVVDVHQTILPSFGVFTGGYSMELTEGRKIFGIAGNKIFNLQ